MESENKITKFGEEVVCYVVAELHVHAILSGAVLATAHRIEENKVGIVVSGVLIVGMFILKRRYPHKIFHMVRLDRLYHRATGKLVRIDGQDYHEKNGFLVTAKY
jgi:hypothetical protein